MKQSRRCIPAVRLFLLPLGLLLAMSQASGEQKRFTLVAVEMNRSEICRSQNRAGYQVQFCLAPAGNDASTNSVGGSLQLGLFDNSQPDSGASNFWILYE